MTREEIENRIIVCEMRTNAYRDVGNTKIANKYDNEKYKWEKLLSDLELLDEKKVKELLDYKKGYLNLEQENKKYKEVINKAIDKLYCYGEALNPEFQKEMLEILGANEYRT